MNQHEQAQERARQLPEASTEALNHIGHMEVALNDISQIAPWLHVQDVRDAKTAVDMAARHVRDVERAVQLLLQAEDEQ